MNAHIGAGFCLSFALHIVLLIVLVNRELLPQPQRVFDVDFVVQPAPPPKIKPVPEDKAASRQIVTPPDEGRNITPKESRMLSDVDSYAETEQIRRGDGLDAGPVPGPGAAAPPSASVPRRSPAKPAPPAPAARPAPAPKEQAPPSTAGETAAKRLDLSPDYQMLNQLQAAAVKKPKAAPPSVGSEPQPFSRAAGAGARFIGFSGATDFVPGIRDGDITLLNAKADKYAVFVRRVATQVFQHLRQNGWNSLRVGDIQGIREYAAVRAKLGADGNLIAAELIGNSHSPRFDTALKDSVQQGARDPHPPPDARTADGSYVFIFLAKSWVRLHSDPRTGAVGEQRWLLLKTGLE